MRRSVTFPTCGERDECPAGPPEKVETRNSPSPDSFPRNPPAPALPADSRKLYTLDEYTSHAISYALSLPPTPPTLNLPFSASLPQIPLDAVAQRSGPSCFYLAHGVTPRPEHFAFSSQRATPSFRRTPRLLHHGVVTRTPRHLPPRRRPPPLPFPSRRRHATAHSPLTSTPMTPYRTRPDPPVSAPNTLRPFPSDAATTSPPPLLRASPSPTSCPCRRAAPSSTRRHAASPNICPPSRHTTPNLRPPHRL